MKKRIRKTGEIVDVIGFRIDKGEERDWNDYVHYKTLDKLVTGKNGLNLYQDFEDVEEELTKDIDWEEVRINASISAMNAAITANWFSYIKDDKSQTKAIAENAVLFADALITELKKGGDK